MNFFGLLGGAFLAWIGFSSSHFLLPQSLNGICVPVPSLLVSSTVCLQPKHLAVIGLPDLYFGLLQKSELPSVNLRISEAVATPFLHLVDYIGAQSSPILRFGELDGE